MLRKSIMLLSVLYSVTFVAKADDLTSVMLTKSCTDCNFSDSQFPLANLSKTTLTNVDFSGSDLSNADFSNAVLNEVAFSNTNLKGVNFSGAQFQSFGASFENSDLRGSNFSNSVAVNIFFSDSQLSGVSYSNATANQLRVRGDITKSLKLQNLNLGGMQSSVILEGKFEGLDFSGGNARIGPYEGQSYSPALKSVSILNSNFDETTLDGSDLSGSSIESTSFRNSSLQKVNFRNATLKGVDFTGADLTGARLEGAKFCEVTAPDGTIMYQGC